MPTTGKTGAQRAKYAKAFFKPRGVSPEIEDRKIRFDKLNAFVRSRNNGWIISVQGKAEVTVECLENSTLPDELRGAGYTLTEIEGGERIIPGSIVERLELSSSGAFMPATEGSTKPVYLRSHSGICKTRRYSFSI
jgi:hypothetical protein